MKTGLISKIIKMCIVGLLPLLAAVAVGSYAYGYYQDRFFGRPALKFRTSKNKISD